jgi:Immunity protein 8
MITAEIKRLHSPDIPNLASYVPSDFSNFGFLLQILAGPVGDDSEESFDVVVCTPGWLFDRVEQDGILSGRHHLLMKGYDYGRLERFISSYCANCRGGSWQEVAEQLGRLGRWEFEDYQLARKD